MDQICREKINATEYMIWDDAIKRHQTEIICEARGERVRLGQHLASDGLTYKQAYRST
jgi:hypothetical protein